MPHRFTRVFVAGIVLIAALSVSLRGQFGTWSLEVPLTTARSSPAAAVIGGKFYVFNGYGPTDGVPWTPQTQIYDPAANQWSAGTPAPVGFWATAATALGKVYFFGAATDCGSPHGQIYIFNPAANAWATAGFPAPRCSVAAAAIDGKIYVVGGWRNFGGGFDRLDIYDPATNAWTTGASLPHVVEIAAAVALNGKLYVAGGFIRHDIPPTYGVHSNELLEYDPATNTWAARAAMSTARAYPAAAVVNGRIHVVGGYNATAVLSSHEAYDPATNTWTTLPASPIARYSTAAGVIGSHLYVAGGHTGASGGYVNAVYRYEAAAPPPADALPAITCPANTFVDAESPSGAVVTFTAIAQDAESTPAVTYSQQPGTTFPIGTTTVTATATDSASQTATCSFGVTVRRLPQWIDFPGVFSPSGTFGAQGSGNGAFLYPNGAAFDAGGNLIVADTNNNRIQKFAPGGGWLWSAGGLNRPQDVAVDRTGNVYVADYNSSLIRKFSTAGTLLGTWSGTHYPTGVEVGSDGNVYVAGWGTGRVYVFSPEGALLRHWSAPGAYMLTTDPLGDLYVTDNGGSRVRKFGADGTAKGVWGTTGSGPGQFLSPGGIVADAAGFVYVLDGGNGRVQQLTSAGTFVAEFSAASIGPINVTKDLAGRLWVSDYSGHRLRIFTPSLPNRIANEPDFTVAAGATSGLAVTLSASGQCTVSGMVVHLTGAGACMLTTSQEGDQAYEPAAPVTRAFSIAAPSDTTPPALSLPSTITAEASGPGGASVTFVATASDEVDGVVPVACDMTSGATFAIGTTTVSCTATDAAGNAATGGFDIVVEDTIAPALTLPANVVAEATGPAGAMVTFDASATDAVHGWMPGMCTPMSGNTFPIGTTTVTCSATDGYGNSATESFTVTVQDTTAPQLVLPATVFAAATGPTTVVNYQVTATDAASPSAMISCTPAPNSHFAIGTTAVSCSATDAAGNLSAGSFSVIVVDTTPPALNCPGDISISANTSGQATLPDRTAAAVVSDFTAVIVQQSPASGTAVGLGLTTVTITATDAHGNVSSCQTTVTVAVGGEAVTMTVAPNQSVTTDMEHDGATVPDPIEVTVTTPVGGSITIQEEPASAAPGEFTLLGHRVHITGPSSDPSAEPSRVTFMLDASILPPGRTASSIEVFRNGEILPECLGGPNQPPCITMRLTMADGDVWIEVRTHNFSEWAFGVPGSPITAASIAQLVNATPLNAGQKNSLTVKLDRGQIRAFVNEVEALRRSGRLDAATANGLVARAQALVRSE